MTSAGGSSHALEVGDIVHFYRHGWHSWCPTAWADPAVPPRPITDPVDRMGHADPVHAFDDRHGGSGVGAVEHGDGSVSLLGALAPGAWVHLEEGVLVGSYEGEEGGWVALHGSEEEVFTEYAQTLSGALGRRGGRPVRLWCSWYSYYADVTAPLMEAAVDGLAGLPFDVVQVDDGWQRAIGDWHPNVDFPAGMEAMADRIRAAGFRPGLWLAPFIVKPESDFFARHADLLLRDDAGDPVVAGENWGGPYFALDVTHPAALGHLEEVMGAARDWGFEFFKLDFIYAAALPGRHHTSMPREVAFRSAVDRIRTVVGDETYLLACGAPVVASIGVFDGIRVGPDVGPVWEDGTWNGIHRAMVNSVSRLWLQPAIDVDPDVVYFRHRDVDLSPATREQVQALAQVAGFKGSSDPPDWMTPAERDALSSFLASEPAVRRLGRYRWEVDGVVHDFAAAAQDTEPQWAPA